MKKFIALTEYDNGIKVVFNTDYIVKAEKEDNYKTLIKYNYGQSGYFIYVKEPLDEILEILNS